MSSAWSVWSMPHGFGRSFTASMKDWICAGDLKWCTRLDAATSVTS